MRRRLNHKAAFICVPLLKDEQITFHFRKRDDSKERKRKQK